MDRFLETYNLPKLNQEEPGNVIRSLLVKLKLWLKWGMKGLRKKKRRTYGQGQQCGDCSGEEEVGRGYMGINGDEKIKCKTKQAKKHKLGDSYYSFHLNYSLSFSIILCGSTM